MKTLKLLTTILILGASSLFAGGDTYYEHAKVIKSEPIFEYVYETKSNKECYEEKVRVNNRKSRGYNTNSIGLDTIIGATTGVIIGNQIGKGNGRTAAKIIGGLMGGAVANNMRDRYEPYNDNRGYTYETRTKCYDNPTQIRKKMITGYKNYFVYNGNEHFKVSNKIRRKVRITHTIDF